MHLDCVQHIRAAAAPGPSCRSGLAQPSTHFHSTLLALLRYLSFTDATLSPRTYLKPAALDIRSLCLA